MLGCGRRMLALKTTPVRSHIPAPINPFPVYFPPCAAAYIIQTCLTLRCRIAIYTYFNRSSSRPWIVFVFRAVTSSLPPDQRNPSLIRNRKHCLACAFFCRCSDRSCRRPQSCYRCGDPVLSCLPLAYTSHASRREHIIAYTWTPAPSI